MGVLHEFWKKTSKKLFSQLSEENLEQKRLRRKYTGPNYTLNKILEISSPGILNELADHPNPVTRAVVARNPNTPAEVLVKLSTDDDVPVRVAVAAHKNTPRNIIVGYLMDEREDNLVQLNAVKYHGDLTTDERRKML